MATKAKKSEMTTTIPQQVNSPVNSVVGIINYITSEDLKNFDYNPYNPRNKNQQIIALTAVAEKNEDGLVTTSYNYQLISDEKLSELGVKVTPEYRRAFNELINSLVVFNDDEAETVTIEVMNPLRVAPQGAVEDGVFTVLSGNTRLHIIKQIIEQRGESKVFLTVPYTVVEDFAGLPDLLSNGLRDNTGIPLDSTAHWDVLTNAFEASKTISDDLDNRLAWVRDAVTYPSNGQPNGNKRIPSSVLSKWAITIKAPEFVKTFEKYVNKNFLSRFHALLSSLVDINDPLVQISITTELAEHLAETKKTTISTEKTYGLLADHLKKKYNPEPQKEDEGDGDDEETTKEDEEQNSVTAEAAIGKMKHQIKVSLDKMPSVKDTLTTVQAVTLDDVTDIKALNGLLKTLVSTVEKINQLVKPQ